MNNVFKNRLGWAVPTAFAAIAPVIALVVALPVAALELVFSGPAELTASRSESLTSIRLPTGPFSADSLPTQQTEGALEMAAFRVELKNGSTLDLMRSLRGQVEEAGFALTFECETEVCGGYDFRYGITVLPEPDMHVNLGDFRYLAAQGQDGVALALLVSRTGNIGFAQITQVAPKGTTASGVKTRLTLPDETVAAQPAVRASGLGADLDTGRAVVLEDLVFPSGSSSLEQAQYASLAALAAWLKAEPARQVMLVGHTDASGGLDGNIKLSKLRAESVRQALLFRHKISPGQVQAEGVGFLAPRDTNLTEAGRNKNRRVEVILTSTALPAP